MKTFRKSAAVFLIIVLTAVLCACGQTEDRENESSSQKSTSEEVTESSGSGSEETSETSSAEEVKETASAFSPKTSSSEASSAETPSAEASSAETPSSETSSAEASQAASDAEAEEESTLSDLPEDVIEVSISQDGDNVTVGFSRLPVSAEDIERIDTEYFQTPQYAAAMFALIMCTYPDNPEAALEMIDYINGPEELSDYDRSYLKDRMEGKSYKPFSYFEGAVPSNDYKPDVPYFTTVKTISNTYDEDGYARFVMQSSGADSARPVTVRKKSSTGDWFLWEEALLADMRPPASEDAWG